MEGLKRDRDNFVTVNLNHSVFSDEPVKLFEAIILCQVPSGWDAKNKNRNAYVVKDVNQDEVFVVPEEMITTEIPSFEPQVLDSTHAGRYITFNVVNKMYDTNGQYMFGKELSGTLLHELPNNWVLFKVDEPHYEVCDCDNWFTGFGIRKTRDIYFKVSLEEYKNLLF